jgi:hypothetical protein
VERFAPGPKPIDVPELARMRTCAKGFLARRPERTLEICARALKEEQRLLAQVGRRIRPTMDIAEPGTDDAKVRRAHEADIRVAPPAEAWELLKAAVDKAERGLFDDGTGVMVAAQLRAEQQEEADRRPWQAFWRPRELSDRQYHEQFVAPFGRRDRAVPYERRSDRGFHRVDARVTVEPQKKSSGDCAGAALLFVAALSGAAPATSQLWPVQRGDRGDPPVRRAPRWTTRVRKRGGGAGQREHRTGRSSHDSGTKERLSVRADRTCRPGADWNVFRPFPRWWRRVLSGCLNPLKPSL